MNWIISGIISAVLAWVLNKKILHYWGDKGTVWVTPVVEEMLKTVAALVLGADIILTHGVFGTIEAVYDVNTAPKRGVSAALVSFWGHLMFGAAANIGYLLYGHVGSAILAGAILHLAWNVFIDRIERRARSK